MSIREDLQNSAEEQANDEYVDAVLDEIIEQGSFAYPEALVSDQIHHMLHMLDQDLRQRGMNLEVYQKVTGKLHEDYHDDAVNIIKRSLAVQELTEAEQIEVTEADLDAEIDRVVEQFGEQAAAFRSIYNNDNMRANLRQDLLNRKLRERVAQIAKGENPAVVAAEAPVETPEPEEAEADEVAAADDESDEGDSE